MLSGKKLNILMVMMLCSSAPIMAEETIWDKAHNAIDKTKEVVTETEEQLIETKEKIEEVTKDTVRLADKFVDDTTITTKVKKAIAKERLASGYEISVTTKEGIVTLTGFVPSVEWQLNAVKLASEVEGVRLVSDKLIVREDNPLTVKGYFSDSAITSEIKSNLLMEKDISSINVGVETVDGIVQLSGTIRSKEESLKVEMIAKRVNGVKTVKNDLEITGKTFETTEPEKQKTENKQPENEQTEKK